ncbi:spore germination protein GerPC [Paenibacillus wynnii]|uniref:spore germination protein GerPC n=1 Tax=Paenibacillus wynnii TaxID=268407 RepID=UPI00279229AA|nr:spore germination protein GerPC [Paenibacillus wynnii]MDQ0194288.1 spore germination protein PC [Paenibacillus wynnii]
MHPFYVQQLFDLLSVQSEKLQQLEKMVRDLQSEVDSLKNNKAATIGPINYHFEQLKIEKLEGTLNIGVTPSEGNKLEEVMVNGQSIGSQDADRTALYEKIRPQVVDYLQQEAPERILQLAIESRLSINETYIQMVMQDLQRQMDERIFEYLGQLPVAQQRLENDEEICVSIFEQIKVDIDKTMKRHVELEYEAKVESR